MKAAGAGGSVGIREPTRCRVGLKQGRRLIAQGAVAKPIALAALTTLAFLSL